MHKQNWTVFKRNVAEALRRWAGIEIWLPQGAMLP